MSSLSSYIVYSVPLASPIIPTMRSNEMKCITAAGSRTYLFHNNQQQLINYRHFLNSKTRSWPQPKRCFFYANTSTTQTTQALLISDLFVVLAAVDINIIPQPKGVDMNVFLQTGGLMLSVYLLANFVVPNIVMKQLDEAQEPAENNKNTVDAETSNEQQQTPPKKTKKKKMKTRD